MIEGGLQIWDPGLAILAMSGKLIWQLYVNKNHPVSQIFRKKYLKGGSLRKATAANTLTGTAIWNSYRKSFGFFNNHLFRIPSNGKRIHLWEDKIFGNPPLSSIIPLTELMNWATNKGLSRLADICSWIVLDIGLAGLSWTFLNAFFHKKICCFLFSLVLHLFTTRNKTVGDGVWMGSTRFPKVILLFKPPTVQSIH